MDEDFFITIDRLRNQFNIEDKYIPALMMTAYYESTLDFDTINENKDEDPWFYEVQKDEEGNVLSKDIGYFQINAASFYDKQGNPDPTLTRFFEKMGDKKELSQSAFEDKLLGEKYNTAYAAHIIKDFHEHSTKDPFGKWTAYTDYVKPFLQGDPIPGKTLQEQVNGIQAYMEAYMYIHGLKEKESIKKGFSNPKIKVLDNFKDKLLLGTRSYDIRQGQGQSYKENK